MDRLTVRVVGSGIIAVTALFVAVLARRADAVVVAAPFALLAFAGLAVRVPEVSARVVVPERLLENEQTPVVLELDVVGAKGRVRATPFASRGLELADDAGAEILIGPGSHRLEWDVRSVRWGLMGPVRVALVVTDRLGTRAVRRVISSGPVRVIPLEETVRRVVAPHALRTIAGAHLSRQRGDGVEFADTREFTQGDRARDVNWRVTARRGELWVDQRRPERSGEVVLFLDTFASVGDDADSTLRRGAEVAAALASRHIGVNDRVGLVDLGGLLRWMRPGGGTSHLYRLIDTIVETEQFASSAVKTIDVLPARALTRRCLVVALTPLIDARGIDAIRTLRARGFDVAVVEVVPSGFLPEPRGDRARLARRLWEMEREALRAELRGRGVAVAEWKAGEPVDSVLDALGVFRLAVLRAAR
jgi:uncharacterized protein (DUF58 family)